MDLMIDFDRPVDSCFDSLKAMVIHRCFLRKNPHADKSIRQPRYDTDLPGMSL